MLESCEGDSALGGIGEVSESNRVVNDYGVFRGNGFGNRKGEFPKWDGDRRFSDVGNVGIHGWRIEKGGPEPGNSGLEDTDNSERGWGNTGKTVYSTLESKTIGVAMRYPSDNLSYF